MKKAILIVSFGTTYPDTRQKNIAAITRQAEFEPQSHRLQVDDFWVKPITEHQLGEAFSRLLQGKRGSNESGEKEKYE